MKRAISEGYDPEGRGTPQGYESDGDSSETLLLGGKQLDMALYRAWELAPTGPNVLRAKELGHKVMMRPRGMPRDAVEEIAKQSNRNNKGVQDTLPERVLAAPGMLANFRADLANRQIDPSTLPSKGEYTYHKLLAIFISERHEGAIFAGIDTYSEFQLFNNAKQIYTNLTKSKIPGAAPSASDPLEVNAFQVHKFASWVEENTDAEEIEKTMGRCLSSVAVWSKEMSNLLGYFASEDEGMVWEYSFYVGLEACLPVDDEAPLNQDCYFNGVPKFPLLFTSKMTVDTMEKMMGMLGAKVKGVAPSTDAKPSGNKGSENNTKKNKRDDGAAALTAFKEHAADAATIKSTIWVDTLKTAIVNPFACLQEIVNFVVNQSPQLFSAGYLAGVPGVPSSGGNDNDVAKFVEEFLRGDDATNITNGRSATAAASDLERGSEGTASAPVDATDAVHAQRRLQKFRMMYHDESLVLRLTSFAKQCNLTTDWGYEELMDRAIAVRDSGGVDSVFEVLFADAPAIVEPEWENFANLCIEFVYEAGVKMKEVIQDTIDAIFTNKDGAMRLTRMHYHIALLAVKRRMPETPFIMNKVIDDMTSEVTNSFVALLRRIRTADLYKKAWQAFMKYEAVNACKDCVSTISQELDSAATANIKKETAGTPSTTGVTTTPSVAAKRHMSDNCIVRILGTKGSPSQFRIVVPIMELALTRRCSVGTGPHSDSGYSKVYEKDGILCVDAPVPRGMLFNYFGSLSLVPSEGAIKIAEVFNASIYAACKDGTTSPWFLAAWGVKAHRSVKAAAKKASAKAIAADRAAGAAGALQSLSPVAGAVAVDIAPGGQLQPAAAGASAEQPKAQAPPAKKPRVSKPVGPTKAPADEPSMNVKVAKFDISLSDIKRSETALFFKVLPDPIPVEMPYLEAAAWTSNAVGTVQLTRGGVPGMLSKETCKDAQKSIDEKRAKETAANNKVASHAARGALTRTACPACPEHLKL
ncbi:unnamed protein product [Prorocentrum cordatum]|uniref:Uncharacterized protein n=1 Tax=Prorocentrum cordatum TaxID=2364126 RepID=A0ABN9WGJ4_9DINO|nr:unnamed protein product [Polarella glacialis]